MKSVEGCENLALLHPVTGLNATLGHLAGDAEALIGFDAGADLIVTDALFYQDDNPSRADIGLRYREAFGEDLW